MAPLEGATLAHHLFAVILDEGVDRERFRKLLADPGVQTSVPLPAAHGFSIYGAGAASLPVTEAYSARTVTLPLFPHIEGWQLDLVVDTVAEGLSAASAPHRGPGRHLCR